MRSVLGVRKAREGVEGAGQPIDLTQTPTVKRAARKSLRSRCTAPATSPSQLLPSPVLPDGPSRLALSPSPTPSQSEVLSDHLALAASEPAAPLSRSPEPELAPRPKHVVAFLNWGADSARRAPRAAPPVGQQDARRPGTQGEEANTVRGGGSPEASLSAGSFQIAAAAPPAGDGSSLFLKPGGGLGSHL